MYEPHRFEPSTRRGSRSTRKSRRSRLHPRSHALLALLPLLALSLLAAFAAGCGDDSPDAGSQPEAELPPLEDWLEVRRQKGASFSHDGTLLAWVSDRGGKQDVWVAPVAGGEPRRVSDAAGVIHSFAFSPTEDRLVVESDVGGNDQPRIYLTDSSGREPEDLLPQLPEKARIGFISWAPDGSSLLYITHFPGDRHTTIHELDLESRTSTEVWTSTPSLSFAMASPDLRRLVLLQVHSDVDFDLYLYDRDLGGEPIHLTPWEDEATYTPTGFSPDGNTLYYTTTRHGEFTVLRALELDPGAPEDPRPRTVLARDWDVEDGRFSRGGDLFVTVTNRDGTPEVEVRRVADGEAGREVAGPPLELPLPLGKRGRAALVPVAFSPDDRFLVAEMVTDTVPESHQLVDLEEGTVQALEPVLPPSLRGRPMVTGELLRYTSFDGLEVPAYLYRPAGDGPHPAVIRVHGGPNAQAKRRFSGFTQYLVARGYAVLVPNVRGSTGYGKTYSTLDNLDLGGAPLSDVVAGKEWLVRHAGVDPERVAVLGASYGGYMALAAATFRPGEFAAHVDFFGPSDLEALVRSYPAYWAVYATYTHKKWGDPNNPDHDEYQYQRSPLHFTERVRSPLLVVQGENDARVPREQSDRIVAALAGRGVPVHYLVIPGEGHGFSKVENRLTAYGAAVRFLDRYLLGDPSVEVLPRELEAARTASKETVPAAPEDQPG